ncbi:subunit I/j of mitochondrial ATP synthase [Metschnikowia bicuspidata var. bicuspidata NRRL YB-4993]|uniref:Subunit I/j of mitochondrial ATP synthase n=1 Tax=Metschnikowia bicuspidata var. bicuspidata NRRL YB-4993 TaxID=869754 RepID=A0A1A0HB00_9ASCO|nr:subunit I/j of mitochondrial ATP synthase [Metschnikowia bicuspidata var. bicuspidata NRRL YB-4993]OBA21063.1 subunit I/j of mitochondrial ATP synthase [Metschnikowia bicuspidata var. bicuspidata NRRL YB-4993]
MRSYPTPILKNYWPFAVGAAISFGLIVKAAEALMNSDEFINDPRHPRFAKGGKFIDLEKKD